MTSSETEPELLRDRGILVRLSYTLQPGGGGVPLAHHLCTIIVIAKERRPWDLRESSDFAKKD